MYFNPLDKSGFIFMVSTLWGKITNKFDTLAKVAKSGNYIDLTNKPEIPSGANNLTTTEVGKYLDATQGKVLNDEIAELNRKLPSDYYTESKSANISPNNWVTINSAVLKNGIYDVKANVSYSVSADVSIVLSIETDPYTNTVSVRGSMGGGGGLYVSNLIDARNRNITVNVKTLHVNSSVSEATSIFSYIRLC